MTTVASKRALEGNARLEKYRQHADLPLLVLSIAVIPLVAVEYLTDPGPRAEEGLEITYTVIWFAFVADYLIELLLSRDKREYARTAWVAAPHLADDSTTAQSVADLPCGAVVAFASRVPARCGGSGELGASSSPPLA
jgi:hypothetical protein